MTLTKCDKGHFYDGDKYTTCPHCANVDGEDNRTLTTPHGSIMSPSPFGEDEATVSVKHEESKTPPTDDDVTRGWFSSVSTPEGLLEPAVGWLVCVKGKLAGKDFRLKSGKNFVGRDTSMDVCLAGEPKVSRIRHAVVIYDPKQNSFLAQTGDSKELFYLNGELVVNAAKLSHGDRLEVGDVELLFVPLCDEKFQWQLDENN